MADPRFRITLQQDGVITQRFSVSVSRVRRCLWPYAKQTSDGHYPILVLTDLAYGDALMLGPAIARLREKFPHSPVHLVSTLAGTIMFENDKNVDLIITYGRSGRKFCSTIRDLYLHVYDLETFLVQDPEILWKNIYQLFHEKLGMTPRIEPPQLTYTDDELCNVQGALRVLGLDPANTPLAIVHGESSAMMRRWPREYVAELAKHLVTAKYSVLIMGYPSADVFPQNEENIYHSSIHFSQLKTREIFLLAKFASIIIATDSVFSHLAVAFAKPSVLLYGPFRPELLAAPLTTRSVTLQCQFPCGPCHIHKSRCHVDRFAYSAPCMRALEPRDVFDQVQDLLTAESCSQSLPQIRLEPPKGICPHCSTNSCRPLVRKGDVFYFLCPECNGIFGDPRLAIRTEWSKDDVDRFLVAALSSPHLAPPTGISIHVNNIITDFIKEDIVKKIALIHSNALSEPFCDVLTKNGWECAMEDIARAGSEAAEELYDTVIIADAGSVFMTPDRIWKNVERWGGVECAVVFLSPVSDYCSSKEATLLQTWPLSEQLFIPSLKTLRESASNAFQLVYSSRVFGSPWHLCIWKRLRIHRCD